MTTRMWGEAYRTSTVCVDSYQSGILNGRLYHRSVESGKTFQCLTQLLQEIENTLDTVVARSNNIKEKQLTKQ